MAEMRRVVRVWWAWDYEKEEQWLNEMAQSGWALRRVGFCVYWFERTEPGAYIVRLEMHGMDPGYVQFMEDTGAEYIGHVTSWQYFRRPAELGGFDLFSDVDSRIQHLRRIGAVMKAVLLANAIIGVANSLNPIHIGWLNLLVAMLPAYALGRVHEKRESLQAERLVHE